MAKAFVTSGFGWYEWVIWETNVCFVEIWME